MSEPWTTEWKEEALQRLREEYRGCKLCRLHESRSRIVFGRGNLMADILMVGEAPGSTEDSQGVPFVGESGDLLKSMADSIELNLNDVYITNVCACRPPNNRPPLKEERVACLERLKFEIYLIDPLLIVLLGKTAVETLTGSRASLESTHGQLAPIVVNGRSLFGKKPTPVTYQGLITYHPAYILRTDSIDPNTGKWHTGGPAEMTHDDLSIAARLVEEARRYYRASAQAHELQELENANTIGGPTCRAPTYSESPTRPPQPQPPSMPPSRRSLLTKPA